MANKYHQSDSFISGKVFSYGPKGEKIPTPVYPIAPGHYQVGDYSEPIQKKKRRFKGER